MCSPAQTTFAAPSPLLRLRAGVTPFLLRLRFRRAGLYLKPRATRSHAAHRHLVSEPSPWVWRKATPVGAWLRIVQSQTFLPYPRSLPWPPTAFPRRLGSLGSKEVPAIRRCRHTPRLHPPTHRVCVCRERHGADLRRAFAPTKASL